MGDTCARQQASKTVSGWRLVECWQGRHIKCITRWPSPGRAHLQVGVQMEQEMMVMSWKCVERACWPLLCHCPGGTVLVLVVVVFLGLMAETGSQ